MRPSAALVQPDRDEDRQRAALGARLAGGDLGAQDQPEVAPELASIRERRRNGVGARVLRGQHGATVDPGALRAAVLELNLIVEVGREVRPLRVHDQIDDRGPQGLEVPLVSTTSSQLAAPIAVAWKTSSSASSNSTTLLLERPIEANRRVRLSSHPMRPPIVWFLSIAHLRIR